MAINQSDTEQQRPPQNKPFAVRYLDLLHHRRGICVDIVADLLTFSRGIINIIGFRRRKRQPHIVTACWLYVYLVAMDTDRGISDRHKADVDGDAKSLASDSIINPSGSPDSMDCPSVGL